MRDIIECMTVFCKLPSQQDPQPTSIDATKSHEVRDSSGTQTEIVAVHTPQVENLPFPFVNKMARPSTLLLIDSNDSASTTRKISEHEDDIDSKSDTKCDTNESISKSSKDETPENVQKDECKQDTKIQQPEN